MRAPRGRVCRRAPRGPDRRRPSAESCARRLPLLRGWACPRRGSSSLADFSCFWPRQSVCWRRAAGAACVEARESKTADEVVQPTNGWHIGRRKQRLESVSLRQIIQSFEAWRARGEPLVLATVYDTLG